MRIICDYCLTEYQVQPPPGTSSEESRFSFRCSNCGRVFSAERPQNLAEASPPDEEAVSAETPELGADILVRQGDQTYSAGDQATVQKWIIERRLNREGLISMDGASWTPLHEVAALQPFLEVVEKLQLLEVPVQVPDEPAPEEEVSLLAVSYTHLTLPTIYSV